MGRDDVLEVGQEGVVLVPALEGSEQRQPGQRWRGQRALPHARAERERLLGTGAYGGPVAGDEVAEAQPLQRVDDGHRGSRFTSPRESQCVEALLGVFVAELEGGVAQVAEYVEVGELLTRRQREVESGDGRGPVAGGGQVHRHEHLLEADAADGVGLGDLRVDVTGRQADPSVGSVGRHDRGGHRHLQRACRGKVVDRVRRLGEDAVRIVGRADVDLDAALEAGDVAEHDRVLREPAAGGQQRPCVGGPAGRPGVAGRRQGQGGSLRGGGGQPGGTFVGSHGGGVGPATLRAGPDELQGCDDVRVGAFGGRGTVPRLAVGVAQGSGGFRERPVCLASLRAGRCLVDGRAHERVANPHRVGLDDHEPGGRGCLERILAEVERRRGTAYDGELARVVRGREQQQRLHRSGQQPAALEECLLHTGAEVQLFGQWRRPAELVRAEPGRKLQQGQRVAATRGDQSPGDVGCHSRALVEELPGSGRVQPAQLQVRDAVRTERCRGLVAGGEHQEHAVGTEPARTEHQRVSGRGVEPVRVLDHAQHGVLLGGGGQQGQRRDRDQEGFDRRPVLLAEHDPQGPGLRAGEPVTQPVQREQQPVQGREGQRCLDLEPLGAQDGDLTRVRDQRLEQCRLAHTRFAVHDQTGRVAVPSLFEQLVQVRGLEVATD